MQQREIVVDGVIWFLSVQTAHALAFALSVGGLPIVGQIEPDRITAPWAAPRPFSRPYEPDEDATIRGLVNSLVSSSTSSDVTVSLTGVSSTGSTGTFGVVK